MSDRPGPGHPAGDGQVGKHPGTRSGGHTPLAGSLALPPSMTRTALSCHMSPAEPEARACLALRLGEREPGRKEGLLTAQGSSPSTQTQLPASLLDPTRVCLQRSTPGGGAPSWSRPIRPWHQAYFCSPSLPRTPWASWGGHLDSSQCPEPLAGTYALTARVPSLKPTGDCQDGDLPCLCLGSSLR